MKKCAVLLTCTGSLMSPSQIDSFKNNPDNREIKVVGVDMKKDGIGKYLADKFYQVPRGDSKDYVKAILEICKKEEINVIFPTSNEEVLTLAKEKELFEREGVIAAVSDYEVLKKAFDKAAAYSFLLEKNLPCPKFFVVKSKESFREAAQKLGFPEKDIVMKPPLGRGGRGTRILTNQSLAKFLLHEKPGSLYVNFEEALNVLKKLEEFPEIIVMEYLPGIYYSVDFLAKDGEALVVVPKIRIEGDPSRTLVGLVKRNQLVEKAIKDICRAFKFDYNINIEMKFSEDNLPIPYDLNPRVAASVAFCNAAGANLIYYALKIALGEEIPKNIEIKEGVKMVRYLKELYVKEDK